MLLRFCKPSKEHGLRVTEQLTKRDNAVCLCRYDMNGQTTTTSRFWQLAASEKATEVEPQLITG